MTYFKKKSSADQSGQAIHGPDRNSARQGKAARVVSFQIPEIEAQRLVETTLGLDFLFRNASPEDQKRIVEAMQPLMALALPSTAHAIQVALNDAPIFVLKGLPDDEKGAQLRATILASLRGSELFGIAEQSDGALTAAIAPDPNAPRNSNATGDPFPLHTDDAILPPELRVEEIALLAVNNPPGTYTGFAILEETLNDKA